MEIEIIKGLLNALKDLDLVVFADELPLNYDFKQVGIYYILNTVLYSSYKDSFNLELHLVGNNADKIKLINSCEEIHNILNKKQLTDSTRVITKNIKRNYLKELDGKHHFILEYYVVNLRRG